MLHDMTHTMTRPFTLCCKAHQDSYKSPVHMDMDTQQHPETISLCERIQRFSL